MEYKLILAKDIAFKAWDKTEQRMCDVEAMHFPLGSASGKDIVIKNGEDYEWRAIADVDLYQVIREGNEHVE